MTDIDKGLIIAFLVAIGYLAYLLTIVRIWGQEGQLPSPNSDLHLVYTRGPQNLYGKESSTLRSLAIGRCRAITFWIKAKMVAVSELHPNLTPEEWEKKATESLYFEIHARLPLASRGGLATICPASGKLLIALEEWLMKIPSFGLGAVDHELLHLVQEMCSRSVTVESQLPNGLRKHLLVFRCESLPLLIGSPLCSITILFPLCASLDCIYHKLM